MNVKCKSTNRFLFKIDVDKLYKELKLISNSNIEIPIRIELPCKACRMVEVYDIYKDHYQHVKSYKKEW